MGGEVITVQIGQCGNQLGAAFFDALAQGEERDDNSIPATSVPAFFRESASRGSVARAVLLDTEPRAISTVTRTFAAQREVARSSRWSFRDPDHDELCIWKCGGSSGAANNWAFGYNAQGERMLTPAMDLIRREAERCGQARQLLILQSLAGGTGSGAGTRITEAIRDEFPSAFALNAVVWPSRSGEVVVQSYNAVLSLAHLHSASDGLLCLHNDEARDLCTRLLRIPRPTFADINALLADHLAGVFLPSHHAPDAHHAPAAAAGIFAPGSTRLSSGGGHAAGKYGHGAGGEPDPAGWHGNLRSSAAGHRRGEGGGYGYGGGGGGGGRGLDSGGGHGALRSVGMGEIVRALCASPLHRLVTLRAVPHVPAASLAHTAGRWEALAKHLRQMLVAGAHSDEGLDWSLAPGAPAAHRCAAAMLFARGDNWAEATVPPAAAAAAASGAAAAAAAAAAGGWCSPAALLAAPELYPAWSRPPGRAAGGGGGGGAPGVFSVWGSPRRLRGQDRTLVLASNCQAPVAPLDDVLARAGRLRAAGAYLHQYARHGIGPEELADAVAALEQVLADYRDL